MSLNLVFDPSKLAPIKPLITVSIEPLRYFTEAIAGPAWQVETLVPRGSSPETYDPTPRQLSRLAQSQAFLRIGYIGYELVWSDRLAENAPQVPFYNLSEGIDLIYGHHHHHHGGWGWCAPTTWFRPAPPPPPPPPPPPCGHRHRW